MSYKRCLLAFLLIPLIVFAVFPSVASGDCGGYWAYGYHESVQDVSGYYYGAYARNYVDRYPITVGSSSSHVNSVGVKRADGTTWAELGWIAYSAGTPIYFRARQYRYSWNIDHYDIRSVFPGGFDQSFLLHWHRGTYPNNVWESHIGGKAEGYYVLPEPYGLTNGIAIANSERHKLYPCDTNYGHFWSLQKSNYYDQWSYWGNTQPRVPDGDDPQYWTRIWTEWNGPHFQSLLK